jgi:hypothetical protein
MTVDFDSLFRTGDARQDNFRSRLFGMFSEDIVRIWARDERAPYRDLGRPTLWSLTEPGGSTIDFTLQRRADGLCFVAEQKAELAFDGYRYLRLTEPLQVAHHGTKGAFGRFLAMARSPDAYEARVNAKPITVHGAILVWGAVTEAGRRATMEHYRFADVLSLEEMVADLQAWRSREWQERVGEWRSWAVGLFDALSGDDLTHDGPSATASSEAEMRGRER